MKDQPVQLKYKTGKLARTLDANVPSVYKVLHSASISPITQPSSTVYRSKVDSWPMLGNDTCGDCVIAGSLHMRQAWNANLGKQHTPTTSAALADYSLYTNVANGVAFDPTTGSGDTGLELNMAASYWMSNGMISTDNDANMLLDGQAEIDSADTNMIKFAMSEFCGVLIGANLPVTVETEFETTKVFADTTGVPGGYGMHCMYAIDFDESFLYAVTWGGIVSITKDWWLKYVDQVKVLFSREWLLNGVSPSGISMTQICSTLESLKGDIGAFAQPV